MNRDERRYGWGALLVASCMGLPLQTWADAEVSEKMRFEMQAKARAVTTDNASDADAGPIIPVLPPKQSTEPDTEQGELFTDNFGDHVLDVFIELKKGLLTVDVQDVPLNQVLATVAQKGEFRELFFDPAQDRINLAFAGLPLKKGLQELLRGRDHMFRYSGENGSLSTVAVYARKTSRALIPSLRRQPVQHPQAIDPDEPDVALLSAQALGSLDENVRLEAVEELANLDNEAEAANVLTEVLRKDENSDVREAALESIADFEDQAFQRRAASLSIHDSEQDIRMRAMDILADVEDWDILRGIAQAHNDPEIRALANEAIEDEQ